MIFYIDFEHKELAEKDPDLATRVASRRLKVKYALEEMAQDNCLVVRYDRFDQRLYSEYLPKAILCSGHNTLHCDYEASDLIGVNWLLRTLPVPLFAICGSFQWMLQFWGGEIGLLSQTFESSADSLIGSHAHERGFCNVYSIVDHPLFTGIPRTMTMHQNHFWEVKTCPKDFERLAESELCAVQAVVHRKLPVFGCQLHPEEFSESQNHGKILLQNFFDHWVKARK